MGDTVDLEECVSQALGAFDKIDHVVEKLVELGVFRKCKNSQTSHPITARCSVPSWKIPRKKS
jgi:hypothetical protein